jgi:translation initiation factor 3 subunit L
LHALVAKSNINKQLEVLKQPTLNNDQQELIYELENDQFAQSNLYKMLGYFSLVGLLRLNSLFGDYYLAINTMLHVELDIHKQVNNNRKKPYFYSAYTCDKFQLNGAFEKK